MYQQTPQHSSKLVNVQEIVESYSHEKFRQQYGNIDDIDIEITWPANAFTHMYTVPSREKFPPAAPSLQLLNSQTFRNASTKIQTHNFRASRSSRATTAASVLKGLVLPPPGFQFPIPDGSPWSDLQLHDSHTLLHEDQKWEVDTPVKVRPGTQSNAHLLIQESNQSYAINVITEIRGKVNVKVTQDGRPVTQFEVSLVDILQGSPGVHTSYEHGPANSGRVLEVETMAQIDVRYGITQRVKIEETPLGKVTSSERSTNGEEEDSKLPDLSHWTSEDPTPRYKEHSRTKYEERIWVDPPYYHYDSNRPKKTWCNCIIM